MNKPPISVSLIAAVARNYIIGQQGDMPWDMPSDLRYFKQMTLRKAMILGRKTFDSFGQRALPGRLNIVLSRDEAYIKACLHNNSSQSREAGHHSGSVTGKESVTEKEDPTENDKLTFAGTCQRP